ncbi:hypothetical protein ACMA1I_20065 [Pontibacter sp. 13R65]|uniref:hypothetical protein n=1 Tax=Pontibacter sp. 13R65 TaxID=3127458 RepID=UPI00301CED7C
MLHPYTWTQFFLAAGSTLLFYYLIVLPLYFRDELKAFLGKAKNWVMPQVYLTSSTPDTSPANTPPDPILGAISTQEAPTLSEAAAIQVAPRKKEDNDVDATTTTVPEAPARAPAALPMGSSADFRQETASLLELVAETQMEKEEFLSLLQLILSKYFRTAQSQHQDQAQHFLLEQIQDKLPFELTPEDLQSLWADA